MRIVLDTNVTLAEPGISQRMLAKQEDDSRLRRRLPAIEKRDAVEKRQVLQVIDAFVEHGQLKRKAQSRP